MAVAAWKRSVWSAFINQNLKARAVYRGVCNVSYQPDAAAAGVIKVVSPGAVTVGDYSGTATVEAAGGASIDITLDHKKYFAIGVDDVDAAQTNGDIMLAHTRDAGAAVAGAVDVVIRDAAIAGAGLTTGLGDDTTPLEINSANILDTLIGPILDALDNANVDPDNRWIVLPPALRTKLLLAKVLLPSDMDGQAMRAGFAGTCMGMNVLVSSLVANTTGTKYKVLAGSMQGLAYAESLSEIEALRSTTAFQDIVRGLYVFGADVIQANALALATCNIAAE